MGAVMSGGQLPLALDGVKWTAPPRREPLASPGDGLTVAQARSAFDNTIRLDEAAVCPCCRRTARARKRALSSTLARYLAAMAREQEAHGSPVDVPELAIYQSAAQRGDYAYLRHWGLISPAVIVDGSPSAGKWTVTIQGFAFVAGVAKVPSHVWILDNEVVQDMGADGFSGKLIDFAQALGKAFDYDEVVFGRSSESS